MRIPLFFFKLFFIVRPFIFKRSRFPVFFRGPSIFIRWGVFGSRPFGFFGSLRFYRDV